MFEGLLSFFDSILTVAFSPILKLDPLLGIAIISFIIALFMAIIQKFTTNQNAMKALKEEMAAHNKEMKNHKDNPKKVMEIQKQVMQKNMEFMKHSFKAMFFTIIPLFIIFWWFNAHIAYYPIMPGQEFDVTLTFDPSAIGQDVKLSYIISENETKELEVISNETQEITGIGIKKFMGKGWVGVASWKLKGPEGLYTLVYLYDGNEYDKQVMITNERKYEPIEKRIVDGSSLKSIKTENEPIKPLNLFGWKIGWIGTYIIFSIIFSMILRKILKVV